MFISGDILNIKSDINNNFVKINEKKMEMVIKLPKTSSIGNTQNDIDNILHYYVDDLTKILNIFIISKNKLIQNYLKSNKIFYPDINTNYSETIINYNGCNKYSINVLNYNYASISKKIKKNGLVKICNLDNDNILYSFENKFFIIVDNKGTFKYYPDSLEIYTPQTINIFLDKEGYSNYLIEELHHMLQCYNYNTISINIDKSAYFISDITFPKQYNGYNSNHNSNNNENNNDNNYGNNDVVNNNSICNTENQKNSFTYGIGSIFSWINPWAYSYSYLNYKNNCKNDNNISNIEYSQSNNSTSPSNKDIQYFIHNSKIKSYNKNQNYHIIKYTKPEQSDKPSSDLPTIKLLRPQLLDFPIHITDISVDNNNNLIINGNIEENSDQIEIIFNKFLLNPIIRYKNKN
jgi:hypothetical protein